MANHYIRAGATGAANGSNWDDAWTDIPRYITTYCDVIRGDTYYYADGTYDGWKTRTDKITDGSGYVVIKKATIDDHGTDIGWNTSYGTGQSIFTSSIEFVNELFYFDGQIGSGTSGYGFLCTFNSGISTQGILISGGSSIHIKHTEFYIGGEDNENYATHGIKTAALTSDSNFYNNIQISNCYFHDSNNTWISLNFVQNSIIEHCFCIRRHDIGTLHGDGFIFTYCGTAANNIIRYNILSDFDGTGMIVIENSIQSDFDIYNNIFYSTNTSRYASSPGIITSGNDDLIYNINIYNNTFFNVKYGVEGTAPTQTNIITWGSGSYNIYAYNNLIYGIKSPIKFTNVDNHNFNSTISTSDDSFNENNYIELTSDPFVDSSNYDFRLKPDSLAINSGTARLASTDILGNTFITNDIGAYAYIPTTYYVSTSGSDSFNGLTEASAWKTIAKVSSGTFNAGDIIRFKCGDTWTDEQLTIHNSGSTNNPITYSTYGTGAKPVIDGNDSLTYGIYANGKSHITIDGFIIKNMRKDSINTAGIYIKSGKYNTVSNCDLSLIYYATNPMIGGSSTAWEGQYGYGIYTENSDSLTINNNTVHDVSSTAIMIQVGSSTTIHDFDIYNNTISNSNAGIRLGLKDETGRVTGGKIFNNTLRLYGNYYYTVAAWHLNGIHVWARSGIPTATVDNLEIYNNYFEDTGSSKSSTAWMYFEYNCRNFKIHHNVFNNYVGSYALRIKGDADSTRRNFEVYNNTFSVSCDMVRFNNSTGMKFKNNIFNIESSRYQIFWIETLADTVGFEEDYNLIYGGTTNKYRLVDITYDNNEWKALGYSTNTVIENPLFVGGTGQTSFQLQTDSPAIDNGLDLGFTSDFVGNPIPKGIAPDIGAFEYTPVYYVDYTNGDDSNNGTTTETPWKTIAKVSSSTFIAGDIIRFKCGDTWTEEQLTVHDSGSANNPITYSTYGSGNKPIIDGNDTLTYGIYANNKSYITIDGLNIKKLRKDITAYGVSVTSGSNNIVCNCDISEVYYNENPGTGGGSGWEKLYGYGIYFKKSDNPTIYNNNIQDVGAYGIMVTSSGGIHITNVNIYNNEITNFNIGIGVSLSDENVAITGGSIYGNYIHDFNNYYYCDAWHRDGIFLFGRTDSSAYAISEISIFRNYMEDTISRSTGSTAWIYLSQNVHDCYIHHNILNDSEASYAIKHRGYLLDTLHGGHKIYNNTIYNYFYGNGQSVNFSASTGNDIRNNIFFVGKYGWTFDSVAPEECNEGFITGNNIYYGVGITTSSTLFNNGYGYLTFLTAQTTGYETNSIFANPVFTGGTNLSSAQSFKLLSNSPAINTGTNLGFTSDYEGNLIPSINPSMGAYQYIGNYYVSSSGSDSFDGMSETTPWKTISKVSSSTFIAGDNIRFKCGDTWTGEQLTIHDSGSANNPITYSTYGTGAKPIIDGNNTLTYGIYANNKSYITIDGFIIKKFKKTGYSYAISFSSGAQNTVKNCDISEVYYATNPGFGGGTGWEAQYGIGINFGNCDGAMIYNNTIRDCGSSCIVYSCGDNVYLSTPSEIYNNELTNMNVGIRITTGNTIGGIANQNVKVHHNYIHDFGAYYYCDNWHRDGIHFWSTSANTNVSIENMEVYCNYFSDSTSGSIGSTAWLYIEYNCKNFDIHHNIFNKGGCINYIRVKGISTSTPYITSGHRIYNNTIRSILDDDNGTGILIGYSHGCKIKNNIFYTQKIAYAAPDLDGSYGFEADYNCMIRLDGNDDIATIYGGSKTFAELQAVGLEIHGINANPSFITSGTIFTSSTSFKLLSNSPAINTGTNLGFTSDYEGNLIPSINPSIGAYQYMQEYMNYINFTTVGDTLTINLWKI